MFDYDNYKELHDLVRSAELYYRQRKQQSEIANILGIAQSKVSRLLQKAHDEGYCRTEFHFPQLLEISSKLTERYNLRHAVVVPTGEANNLKEDLGSAAARYFEHLIFEQNLVGKRGKLSIGLSCGLTLYYMVKQIRETVVSKWKGILNIYPLAADNTYRAVDLFPSTLTGMLAAKFYSGVNAFALPAQILESLKTDDEIQRRRQEILRHSEAGQIFNESQEVDIAFIGLGKISNDTPGFCALAKQYGVSAQNLKKMGAVAEYNYVLIDKDGIPLIDKNNSKNRKNLTKISNRIICVPLSQVCKLAVNPKKLVICIAGGKDKIAGIKAILNDKNKLANVLITDSQTAQQLII